MFFFRKKLKEGSMKKSFSSVLAAAVLVLGLAAFFASCGGGGGGDGSAPAITPISTPAQGAQSATATVTSIRSMSNTSSSLIGFANFGGASLAPNMKMPLAVGPASTAAEKFTARFAPAAKKAAAMRASATGYPMTTSCASGSTVAPGTNNSMTMDMDAAGTSMTMTFINCREGDTLTDGTIAMYVVSQDSNSGSGNITVGSADHPLVQTIYSAFTSTVINEVSTASVTISFTATNTSSANPTVTMNMNGYFDDVDHVAHMHEKQTMNNFSFAGQLDGSTTTIGGTTYDVVTATVNGTVTGTTYASDTDQTISYQEGPNTFTNVVIVDKQPVFGTGDEYFSIDGTITVSTTPAECIDGTFSITTSTPLQIDGTTGETKAGRMTINGNVVATFNSGGSVSVSVDGGAAVAYSRTELDSLCAL
jgi:hypothetical protein